MRVAFIAHDTQFYGANRSLLSLLEGLRKCGVSPFVLCPSRGELTMKLEEHNVPFSVLPFRKWWIWMHEPSIRLKLTLPGRLAFILATLPLVVRKLRRFNPDVIYSNSPITPIGALSAIVMSKPHVWHIRELGWLDYGIKCEYGEKIFQYLLNRAAAVIAISNAVKQIVLSGVTAETYVIYNGVITRHECENMGREAASSAKKTSNYTFSIVGLLHPNKGQEQALKALALLKREHPDVRLLVVGSGRPDYLTNLRKLAKDLGVETQVDFMGYISSPFEAYLNADAVLMCSRYEAMGRVTAEAMASARPVIGYNSTGTAELIEHESTGLLYGGGHEELARCMARLIENPEWAKELGINGWHKAKREFTIETYAERVYKVLKKVTGQ